MRLKQTAKLFDTCPVYDGYSGALLFRAQASTFLESAVEGSTAARRVISVAPDIVLPAHKVVMAMGQMLVIGAGNPDEYAGEVIRRAHWVKLVTDSFQYLSPGQASVNQSGTNVFGQRKFLRETANSVGDSDYDPFWEVFVADSFAAERGYFFKSGTTLYRIRTRYVDVDGFMTCMCDEVDTPLAPLSFTSGQGYDPVSDSLANAYQAASGIFMDYYKAFEKKSQVEDSFVTGDMSLFVKSSVALPNYGRQFTVLPGHRFTGNWQILNMKQEHDAWLCHVRRLS